MSMPPISLNGGDAGSSSSIGDIIFPQGAFSFPAFPSLPAGFSLSAPVMGEAGLVSTEPNLISNENLKLALIALVAVALIRKFK